MFFRVNRQYIINISFIEKLTKFFNYKMIIKLYGFTDLQIIVSKERISQLKSWLDRWRNKETIGHRDLPGIQIPLSHHYKDYNQGAGDSISLEPKEVRSLFDGGLQIRRNA